MGTHPRGTGGTDGTGGSGDLPDAVARELRADERCRTIASVLATCDGQMPLIDLAREVLARERDRDRGELEREAVTEVRTEIYERDLPKLTAAGVVSFDSLVSAASLTSEGEHLLAEP